MTALLFNFVLGIVPTLVLAWAVAADERRPADDRVITTDSDRSRQTTMFLLVYGLWSLSLAMWNWMRSMPAWWIALWLVAGVVALVWAWRRRGRR